MTENAYMQMHADQYPAMPTDAISLLGNWERGAFYTLCTMRGCNNEVPRGSQGEPCDTCKDMIDRQNEYHTDQYRYD